MVNAAEGAITADETEEATTTAAETQQEADDEIDKVKMCLEELLSKQNLMEDAFVQQHMNAQMFIPLCILGGHHRITRLGARISISTLLAAAQRSDKLGVDEEQLLVRPLLKPRRNTVILHDLPEDVEEQELRSLLDGFPEVGSLCTVKPDVNRTAFLSFHTDEDAQGAALWLRSQTLRGQPVKCAVKAEHFLRSFFPAMPGTAPKMVVAASYGQPGQQMVWAPMAASWAGQWPVAPQSEQLWGKGGACDTSWMQSGAQGAPFQGGDVKGQGKGKGKGKGKGEQGPCHGGKWKGKRKGEGGALSDVDSELGQLDSLATTTRSVMPQDGYAPMQEPLGPAGDNTVVDDSELGYTHEFRRYSREQIMEICDRMDTLTLVKPESFARFEGEEKDVHLFRQSPCKEWAPAPTPQISFAPNIMAGEGRKSTGDGSSIPGSPLVEGLSAPKPRKGSAMSRSSWSSSRRSRSTSRVRRSSSEAENAAGQTIASTWEACEWEDWSGGGEGWDPSGRWRHRGSSWGSDWYSSGPQWVEKSRLAEAAAQREEEEEEHPREARKMSWAERVKGTRERSASVGAQQRWQAKSKAETVTTARASGNRQEEAGQAEVAATHVQSVVDVQREGETKAAEDPKAQPKEAEEQTDATQEPETDKPATPATDTHAPRQPTWADKVRLGGSPKNVGRVASG